MDGGSDVEGHEPVSQAPPPVGSEVARRSGRCDEQLAGALAMPIHPQVGPAGPRIDPTDERVVLDVYEPRRSLDTQRATEPAERGIPVAHRRFGRRWSPQLDDDVRG